MSLLDLVTKTPKWKQLIKESDGGDVKILNVFYTKEESDEIYNKLHKTTKPEVHKIGIMGRTINIPRLQCAYGDDGLSYGYSNSETTAIKWNKLTKNIKNKLENEMNSKFNFVLINHYRNGNDYIGKHSDDENDLIKNSIIASLSFGATRKMVFKHKENKYPKKEVYLPHGSLVIMQGITQKNWTHEIPKNPKITDDRWNLTYRQFKK